MTQEYKRRNYFIDPAFQLNFIFKFCIIVIVSSLLIGAAMFFVSQNSTTVAIENTKVVVKATSDFILPELSVILLIVAVTASLVVLGLTLFVSHQIAGPIFRIKKEIELVQGGDLTRQFTIRSADQLQELAKTLDDMTQTLRKKQLAIGGQCRSVSNFLEEKNLSGSKEDREKLLQMIRELYEMLTYFKV
jgi:methyl-accepting chemotaxis protein